MKKKSNNLKFNLDDKADEMIQSGYGLELLNLLADKLQTEQIERRNYLIYLGLNRELTVELKKELAEIVSRYTDSFTFLPTAGFFKGEEELTTIIQIASEHNKIAYDCAEALRKKYKQKGVGVVVNEAGEYRRIIQNKQ